MFKLLSPDSFLGRWLSFLLDALLLSLVWAVCCLAVIPAGAATAALSRAAMRWFRHRESCSLREYWSTLRREFPQATKMWFILLAVAIPIAGDLYLLWGTEYALPHFLRWVSVVLAVLWLVWCGYAFMLQALFENPVSRTLRNALHFIPGSILHTIALAVLYTIALVCSYLLPVFAFLFLGISCYLAAPMCWKAFLPVIPPEMLEDEEAEAEESASHPEGPEDHLEGNL